MLALYACREPHVDNARTKSPPRRSKSPPRSSSSSTLVSTMLLGFVTHRRSIVEGGGCFQRRLFVCPFVNTITSEWLNVGWWNLAVRCIVQISRWSSNVKVGAVLQQYQDGKLRIVEYASHVLNKAECNYCARLQELIAIIFALKVFRPYLLGTKFQLRMDNQAVSFLMQMNNSAGQAARCLDFFLADFASELVYRKGSSNANEDSLSRMPRCSENSGEPCELSKTSHR